MENRLIWWIAILLCASILIPYIVGFYRRNRRQTLRHAEAVQLGADRPLAQYPLINESLCLGCGACVAACPEKDVLAVVDGRAVIVNGTRCIGHGRCAEACPVGALQVGLGDTAAREDIPQLTSDLETSIPGVFIAGELGGLALIRNAVQQGTFAAGTIARRLAGASPRAEDAAGPPGLLDLVIVGAGPAGLSAALAAQREGLSYLVLEQEEAGGAILQYPRKKVVLTQPVDLPLYGRLAQSEYTKEELLEIWRDVRERFRLQVRTGEKLESLTREADGVLAVKTPRGQWRARSVILALGRRGTPRKLGVPGEESSKVAYKLMDAESFRGERILVVGGGDSAVEAALALARQPGNRITLSYRKEKLFRIKKRNEDNLATALRQDSLALLYQSELIEIGAGDVRLRHQDRDLLLPNDRVFIFAGGQPPYPLLQGLGISFGGKAARKTEA